MGYQDTPHSLTIPLMTYAVGDKVLCYHGPKLYEAKIIQYKRDNGADKFFVHYKGWKSKWDEWVECNRIVKNDNDGLILQKKLATEYAATDSKSNENDAESQKTEIPVLFKLGKNFKHFANYDWLQVNKRSKILMAPTEYSAAAFLREYAVSQNESSSNDFIENFISFLDIYIGKGLLYRQERLHYLPLDKSCGACSLYGPAILIRFFAKLNMILQDYVDHPILANFTQSLFKISEYLMKYLNSLNLDSFYITRSEHYEAYYSIN